MCLNYSAKSTAALRRKLRGCRKIIAYKVLRVPYYGGLTGRYFSHAWKPGVNRSSRKDTKVTQDERNNAEVHRGIHVYLDRCDAQQKIRDDLLYGESALRLVPVTCYLTNMVAAGHQDGKEQAVFTKVSVSPRDYCAAMGVEYVPPKLKKKPVKTAAKLSSRAAMLSNRAKKAWATRRKNAKKACSK